MSAGSMPDLADDLAKSNDAPTLEFAYVDETGDPGDYAKGASRTFTLGCVLIPADHWTRRLEVLTATRRDIKRIYGVRLRDELKANYLTRPRGPLKGSGLGDGQLRDIYRRIVRTLVPVSSGVFAIAVEKQRLTGGDPYVIAWHDLMRRLMARSTIKGHPIVLVHDDGDNHRLRKLHRHCRQQPVVVDGEPATADLLVEDPVPRRSEFSYFTQAADLIAYAAFRRVQPPGPTMAAVCDAQMWDEVKALWLAGFSDGIVTWPLS